MISDKLIRETIRNEKNKSVVVEASAGTGKTTLITDRVNALVESGIPLEKLAVVTFTEAAASELRTRIREKLSSENKRTMDQAWITTIHGFASRILKEYFHLCDGVPEFSMEVSHFSSPELEIHWDIFLTEVDSSALRESSESLKYPGSKALLKIAEEIEKCRWFTDSTPLGNTEDELNNTISLWEKQLESLINLCSNPSDKLFTEIQNSLISLNEGTAQKIGLRSGSAGSWGGKDSLKEVKTILKEYNKKGLELINGYSAMLLILPALNQLVIPFVNSMRSMWDKDPTRLSFDDLLYQAWQAVSRSAELRRELNERFSHIFIDEFQDTSLVQVQLFTKLLGKLGLETKLTVVGDPKQSIFGWRSADIETYKDTLARLEDGNALAKTIEVNFRSEISIIDFVNSFGVALFAQVSPEEAVFSCDYSLIKSRPGAKQGKGVTVHRLPSDTAANMAILQAEAIADLIEDPGTTAILFRTGTHLDPLVQALDRKNIPYRVELSRDFHKRKEVEDTASLIKSILCPGDEYALVKTFQSIFFGISDREITLWRLNKTPENIKLAKALLAKLRETALRLPPGQFIETLFKNTCLLPAVRESGYQVTRRLGNLRFILEVAHRTEDYSSLLETLTGKAPMSAEEPSAPPESHIGVVTLSTIHRAKGLAWEHVILTNPGNSSKNTMPAVLTNDRDLSAGIRTAGGLTAFYDKLYTREQARSRAEYRRLLYVAVTRPKQKLDIFLPENISEDSPAGVLQKGLAQCSELYQEKIIQKTDPSTKTEEPKTAPLPAGSVGEFEAVYPDSIPVVEVERERQMQLGNEVHGILEFINFNEPDTWLSNNMAQLSNTLKFPDEAIPLAMNFFKIFDFENAEIMGREYPLLVNGKQYYIDLLIRRNGIYEVIDYKTDRDFPEKRTEFYREKQLLYKKTLERMVGKQVKAKLVFLYHGTIVEM